MSLCKPNDAAMHASTVSIQKHFITSSERACGISCRRQDIVPEGFRLRNSRVILEQVSTVATTDTYVFTNTKQEAVTKPDQKPG